MPMIFTSAKSDQAQGPSIFPTSPRLACPLCLHVLRAMLTAYPGTAALHRTLESKLDGALPPYGLLSQTIHYGMDGAGNHGIDVRLPSVVLDP